MAASPALASGPQVAIAAAREQLAANDCAGAIRTLAEAMPLTDGLADAKVRDDARSAIHFYSALASSTCARPADAREHLRHFFRVRPGHSSLDAAKYPRAFVTLFAEVQREGEAREMFDGFYPGYEASGVASEERLSLVSWTSGAAFQIFADEAEREEWPRLADDAARAAFVERFWMRRDPDSATAANEFRAEVARRIEFADRAFTSPEELRGAMTDRGRVFVILGAPARVHRRPLQRYETTIVAPRVRTPLTGTLERWIYFQGQLPGLPVKQVEFRFITQLGYGEAVMQRDFWPLKALAAGRAARP